MLLSVLVVIGGRDMSDQYHDSVDIYSINQGTISWKRQGQEAPYTSAGAGAAVSGKYIFIAGKSFYFQSNFYPFHAQQ